MNFVWSVVLLAFVHTCVSECLYFVYCFVFYCLFEILFGSYFFTADSIAILLRFFKCVSVIRSFRELFSPSSSILLRWISVQIFSSQHGIYQIYRVPNVATLRPLEFCWCSFLFQFLSLLLCKFAVYDFIGGKGKPI